MNRPVEVPVSEPVARIVAEEMSRLWQAHGIVEMAVFVMGDEAASERPALKKALEAALNVIETSINNLETICVASDSESDATEGGRPPSVPLHS